MQQGVISTEYISPLNSDLDCGNNSLTNVNEITVGTLNYTTLNPSISTPTLMQVLASGADGDGQNITDVGTIAFSGLGSSINANSYNITGIDILSANQLGQNLDAGGYNISDVQTLTANSLGGNLDCGTFNLSGISVLSAGSLGANLDAGGFNLINIGNLQATTLTGDLDCGNHNLSDINELTCGTLNYTTLNPPISSATLRPSSNWYVSASLGNDSTGNGSLGAPYATIGKALSEANAAYVDGQMQNILFYGGGYYAESNTITYGFLNFGTVQDSSCLVNGPADVIIACNGLSIDFNINITNGTSNVSNLVSFNNITFSSATSSGANITDSSSNVHSLVFNNCAFSTGNQALAASFTGNCIMNECNIVTASSGGTDSLVAMSGGVSLNMNECVLNSYLNQYMLSFEGSSQTLYNGVCNNYIASNVVSSTAAPLVFVYSSSYNVPLVFSNNKFYYTDSTTKTSLTSPFSCAIFCGAPASANQQIMLLGNYCNLGGCTDGAPAYNYANNTGAMYIFDACNSSASITGATQNNSVGGVLNVTKFALSPVT